MVIQDLQPFAISFIIGLLIGIEREHSRPIELQVIGVRTFVFIALLGTLTAWLNQIAITIILASFVFAIILLHYLRLTKQQETKRIDIGTTTELTAGVVFCLGYMTIKTPSLAAVIGVVTLLILLGKKSLREFSRNQITSKEIRAAVTILILSFCILPFLPNHPVDPWRLFDPQKFGIIVILIAAIQFGGYVAVRVFGSQFGMIFIGFFGGLVSSTAMFLTLPKTYRDHPAMLNQIIAAALFATVAMLIKVAVILLVIFPEFFTAMIQPLLAMISVGTIIALLMTRGASPHYISPMRLSPLDVKSVLKLALLIFAMLVFIALVGNYLGVEWGNAASFLGGFFEIHSVTLAIATLCAHMKITIIQAKLMLLYALLASFISKFFLLAFFAKNRFGVFTILYLCLILIAGGVMAVF